MQASTRNSSSSAPGAQVWLDGSWYQRSTAFQLVNNHHIVFDGFRFRNFLYESHQGDVLNIRGSSDITIRRCFYDGRVPAWLSYSACFIRGLCSHRLMIENCVIIMGMGQGMNLSRCDETLVRHCVFYNQFISPVQLWGRDGETITLSHNIIGPTSPSKAKVWLVCVSDIRGYRGDHNGYFTRIGPEERLILLWERDGRKWDKKNHFPLARLQSEFGQEKGSIFGNPDFKVLKELLPVDSNTYVWRARELGWDGKKKAFRPWDFSDFFVDPSGPFARSAAGKPIGLDPAAFRE